MIFPVLSKEASNYVQFHKQLLEIIEKIWKVIINKSLIGLSPSLIMWD